MNVGWRQTKPCPNNYLGCESTCGVIGLALSTNFSNNPFQWPWRRMAMFGQFSILLSYLQSSRNPIYSKVRHLLYYLLVGSPPQRCWGMAHILRVFKVSPAHPRIYPRMIWTMPLPSQPKLVLILPTSGGWKAELTWLADYIPRWFAGSEDGHQSTY